MWWSSGPSSVLSFQGTLQLCSLPWKWRSYLCDRRDRPHWTSAEIKLCFTVILLRRYVPGNLLSRRQTGWLSDDCRVLGRARWFIWERRFRFAGAFRRACESRVRWKSWESCYHKWRILRVFFWELRRWPSEGLPCLIFVWFPDYAKRSNLRKCWCSNFIEHSVRLVAAF